MSSGAQIFYKKPVASKIGTLARSAVPKNNKVQTAVNEFRRRWKTTSTLVNKSVIEEITSEYSRELLAAGNKPTWVQNALEAALTGYERVVKVVRDQNKPRNRPGFSTLNDRRAKKFANTRWFNKTREDQIRTQSHSSKKNHRTQTKNFQKSMTETVMYVPYTPGGALRSKLSKMEEGLNFVSKVRYAEELGSTLESILAKDPWQNVGCERINCFPCMTQKGKCWALSVTYQIDCQNCKRQGKTVRYYGETGRTGFDRGQDHVKAIRQGDSKNACGKHQVEMHQGEPWNFSMKIVKRHKYPLLRQTHEGRLVEDFNGDKIPNQRGEWGCNLPPNIMVEGKPPNPKRKGREIPQAGEEFKEHEMEDDTRPKRSKIPRTIIEELGSNKTRDKNSPEKKKGITPTEQNASDQAIQIVAMNIKLEPVLTTFEVDEEQGKITVDKLDDCEEERLAVQGPSSTNVKVNKASKVYEVKYSKNGQVQTYNHKKAEYPSKKEKPKTKKSTPLSGKKSCKFRVQSSVIQNSTGVQSIEGFQGPIDGQNQTGSQNPADGQIPAPTSPQSPAGFQVSKSTISGAKSPVSFQGPVDGQNQAESRNPGGQSPTDGQIRFSRNSKW